MSTPVRRALYGCMAGDTTLSGLLGPPADGYTKAIYHNQAPNAASYPYVVFSKSSGVPTDTFGDPGALETDVWMIKAIDQNTTADAAEAIAARLRDLLNDVTLSISGSTLLMLRRESDVEYPEVTDGVMYAHVGSLFRLVYD